MAHGPGCVAAEAATVEEILTLLAARRGVCLILATAARHHPRADVAYVEVQGAEPAVVSLAWSAMALARSSQRSSTPPELSPWHARTR